MNDNLIETEFACSRWEPCAGFVPEVTDSQVADSEVCGDCGWVDDDHRAPAVVHQLPRTPRPAVPRRLAS